MGLCPSPRPPPGNPPEEAGLRAWLALAETVRPARGRAFRLAIRRYSHLGAGEAPVCRRAKRGCFCQQVSARLKLGRGSRGLRLLVAENTEILGGEMVVQGKAVAVVKSRISPSVCSENRSLPRLKCGSETKNDKFWMHVLRCPIPLYPLLRNSLQQPYGDDW